MRPCFALAIVFALVNFSEGNTCAGDPDVITLRIRRDIKTPIVIPEQLRSVYFLAITGSGHYTKADADALKQLPNLRRIELNYSTCTLEFISSLAKIKTLKRIHFINCGINDQHLIELRSNGIDATVCKETLHGINPFRPIEMRLSGGFPSGEGTDAYEVFFSTDGSVEAQIVDQWRLEPIPEKSDSVTIELGPEHLDKNDH